MTDPMPAHRATPAEPMHINGQQDFKDMVWQVVAVVAGVWAVSLLILAVVAHARGWI
jgi:hypothetical protein